MLGMKGSSRRRAQTRETLRTPLLSEARKEVGLRKAKCGCLRHGTVRNGRAGSRRRGDCAAVKVMTWLKSVLIRSVRVERRKAEARQQPFVVEPAATAMPPQISVAFFRSVRRAASFPVRRSVLPPIRRKSRQARRVDAASTPHQSVPNSRTTTAQSRDERRLVVDSSPPLHEVRSLVSRNSSYSFSQVFRVSCRHHTRERKNISFVVALSIDAIYYSEACQKLSLRT